MDGICIRIALAGLLASLVPGVAAAQQPEPNADCGPVLAALNGMGAAPRYRWTVSAKTPNRRRPFEREQIVIDEVVYLTPDQGRWMKQRIPLSERVSRMADELSRNPISDCHLARTDTVNGVTMQVYAYRQGSAQAGEVAPKQIWIGADDKLPHAFEATQGPVSITMQVDYKEVEAPLH
jgi:hypothetical protein